MFLWFIIQALVRAFSARDQATKETYEDTRVKQLLEDAERRRDENAGLVAKESRRKRKRRAERQLDEAEEMADRAGKSAFGSNISTTLIISLVISGVLVFGLCGCVGLLLLPPSKLGLQQNPGRPGQKSPR